ncbi:MAG: transporter associated domain-containing protein [Pseudomonadota bacterium]|nr:transporter associated domain-containing protein [Pseudomonadota bacterium]
MSKEPTVKSYRPRWLERLRRSLRRPQPEDRDQLTEVLRRAHQGDLLAADALEMIEGVMQVTEMRVREVMIPRAQMKVVQRSATLQQMLPRIIESAHSRFPVIGENRDAVDGILLAKDLLRYFVQGNVETFEIDDIMRPAAMIPESKRLNVLLRDFRHSRNHMAVVVDEYGGVAGLVTIEDVIEQIVGDISDEHDIEEGRFILRLAPNCYSVKALTPIEDFNEYFGTDYGDGEYETISGLVLRRIGYLPRRGETIDLDDFSVEIIRADNRRIHLMQMERTPPPDTGATG